MSIGKNVINIVAARNGFTLRTRTGVYVCTSLDQLIKEVKSYATILQKEAAQPQGEAASDKQTF